MRTHLEHKPRAAAHASQGMHHAIWNFVHGCTVDTCQDARAFPCTPKSTGSVQRPLLLCSHGLRPSADECARAGRVFHGACLPGRLQCRRRPGASRPADALLLACPVGVATAAAGTGTGGPPCWDGGVSGTTRVAVTAGRAAPRHQDRAPPWGEGGSGGGGSIGGRRARVSVEGVRAGDGGGGGAQATPSATATAATHSATTKSGRNVGGSAPHAT